MPKTKITDPAGRFGPRYGKKIRETLITIEKKQRLKQRCPRCKKAAVRRIAKGLWRCKACGARFTSQAYFVEKQK